MEGDIENEIASEAEAGDIGDRALQSNRTSQNGTPYLSFDQTPENRVSLSTLEAARFQPYGISSPAAMNASSDPKVQAQDQKHNKEELPKVLEYASCLIHLAVFGILGVLTRYLLQKLFGPGGAGVTSNQGILYSDLPSNMVGSFLMGWFGIVFKPDISRVSDFLAIGLSTGFLGSLTTFSGWNQKMIELCFQGRWVSSLLGFLIGLFLAAYSIIFGIETAKGFRQLLGKRIRKLLSSSSSSWRLETRGHHIAVMVALLLMLGLLWGVSGGMMREEFTEIGEAQLWLACIVGPFGVWMRWFLARLNGRGLGEKGLFKWVPFGTLIANVSAACLIASLATVMKAVNTKTCDIIAGGIQFGVSGCLSTVSTFIAEFNAMRESKHPWRAYAYAMITICLSFGLGTLIYSVPVWTKGYN
ncbi:camphor resistance CrcB family protein [Trema orientale]|uniref:Camphor resistance CrcB family protein n=1 Tax=Trema orientale TaxID=63057 RepID=A0A2P5E5P3_TREOI|nr:camphor resistance CrcB family protein [Trema orientale]